MVGRFHDWWVCLVEMTSYLLLCTRLTLTQFNKCMIFAPWESALIKLCTIICTSDPYASIVQHADMIAFYLTSVKRNLSLN